MMEEFEEMKKSVAEYHLTSDLFAGKVFEDLEARQELCRILLQNDFRNSAPFYKMENFPGIVERVKFFKIKEEGVTIMCEIADRIRKEGKIEDILELLGDFGKVPERPIRSRDRAARSPGKARKLPGSTASAVQASSRERRIW